MKTILGIIFCVLLLVSCDPGEVAVSGGTDNTVNITASSSEIKMVNGIIYVRQVSELDGFCMSIDSSTLYPDTFVELFEADAIRLREVPYTQEELNECNK